MQKPNIFWSWNRLRNDFFYKQRGTELIWNKPAAPLSLIQGFATFLTQAATNYISNAIKYTPSLIKTYEARDKRDIKGVVTVNLKEENNNLIFSVTDNGMGIPKDEIPKLFNKFVRASNAKEMYTDGTGLGHIFKRFFGLRLLDGFTVGV